ncbi:MAG: hypothetical protein NXI10_05730 [bacterium]|nr:hypothetical protein [bacterium]
MKSYFMILAIGAALIACKDKKPPKQEIKIETVAAEIPEEDNFPYDTLQGLYMADFGGSPIRIALNYVSGTNAIGYDLHKGLQRNITGSVTRSGDSIQLVLSEPGDNKYDGVFTIDFIGIDSKPKGVWVANDEKIPSQEFTLEKMIFDEDSESEEITMFNFAQKFGEMSDTLGQYTFMEDGLVLLKYYPDNVKDWDQQQYEEIKGSWSLDGDKVTINWEPNDIFKGNRLDLTIEKYGEYEYSLKGKGKHELWMMWW